MDGGESFCRGMKFLKKDAPSWLVVYFYLRKAFLLNCCYKLKA